MKPEVDQEMDSLLRAHARREGGVRAATTRGAQAGAHLDADELSAYAEGALPAPTRTRYAAHLADCDVCRHEVVVLARAAGVAERLAERPAVAAAAVPSLSWRERLATWLAPGTWRYALPVVALVAISGVVLLVMTGTRKSQHESATQVASAPHVNSAPEQNHAPAAQPQVATSATPGGLLGDTAANNANNASTATKTAGATTATPVALPELIARNEAKDSPLPPARPVAAPPPQQAQSNDAPATLDQIQATTQNTAANQNAGVGLSNNQVGAQQAQPAPRAYAPEPQAAGSSAPPAVAELNKEQAKTEKPKASAPVEITSESARAGDKKDSTGEHGPRKGRETTRTRERDETATHGPSRSMSQPKDERADDRAADPEETTRGARRRSDEVRGGGTRGGEDAGETRTVAGRQFRRQKNAWVDTAYRAGQATVNVRRDSEQWRALVADEPDLRRIADALGGEVLVVWHGRAYRIKQ